MKVLLCTSQAPVLTSCLACPASCLALLDIVLAILCTSCLTPVLFVLVTCPACLSDVLCFLLPVLHLLRRVSMEGVSVNMSVKDLSMKEVSVKRIYLGSVRGRVSVSDRVSVTV